MVLEEFDEEGNAIVVGNYDFVEGILGKGSYGTVRLAKRRGDTTPGHSVASSIHKAPSRPKRLSNSSSMSVPEGQEDNDESEIEKKPIAELNISMRGRGSLRKSSSAPYGKNPFDVDPNKATSNNVVGQLGLMVKNGFQKASSQLGSFFDDDADKRPEDNLYAVKIYEKSLLKKMRTMERDKETRKLKVHTALEQVEKEVALMKKMHHPNLVSLFEVIDSPESDILYMVIEYMPLGEILSYQDDGTFSRSDPNVAGYNAKTGHFDEATAALFMVDILHGLAYLHQHRVCHRDLKPENILIDARGIVKIADFGVAHFFDDVDGKDFHDDDDFCKHGDCAEAKVLSQHDTEMALAMKKLSNAGMLNKTEGTWCFWSPEMCASQKFSGFAADMWAAGICLYIMVSGKLPFYSEIPTDLFEIIRDGELPCDGMGFSDSLLDLLHATLHKDANERAGVGDCLNHPFLSVAREKRVQQLSQAFERSRKRTVIVSEEDIRKAFRVVTALNPVEIFKTTTIALKAGFSAAKDKLSLSRTSSWSGHGSVDSRSDDEVDMDELELEQDGHNNSSSRRATKKQDSILSQGTSNVSDASSSADGRPKKFRLTRKFKSVMEHKSRRRFDAAVNDCKDDLYVDTTAGKKARFRKSGTKQKRSLRPKNCVIQ